MANWHFTTLLLLCHTLLYVNGQSNSIILPSSTTVTPTSSSTPSLKTSPPVKGAQVNITIYVKVLSCSGASYENVSSSQYRDLERNLKGNLTDFYTRNNGLNHVLTITLQTTQCMGNYVKVLVKITFKPGIRFNIEEDIKNEVKDNLLKNLSVNGTLVEVAFIGVEITFNIKDGECQRVCCDAAGGHVKMVSSCESQTANNSSCEGFKSEEKEEEGHCPGEAEDLCSSACDNIAGDRGSVHGTSLAILGLLAVATLFKLKQAVLGNVYTTSMNPVSVLSEATWAAQDQ
ncbi:PREDICTED: uncharacterized protein LOC107334714 isoform X2 [Acropora digitifera]|uniref:uncharacterized protein LOC107334714 isoform X2 n=1 Tax=Acropora digitifera TaxID=70779 RepID=UPI00077A90FA|nr:PREDICTED: uncharacterized protein LOC107334714 isoform X2 [Acropora digitifera]